MQRNHAKHVPHAELKRAPPQAQNHAILRTYTQYIPAIVNTCTVVPWFAQESAVNTTIGPCGRRQPVFSVRLWCSTQGRMSPQNTHVPRFSTVYSTELVIICKSAPNAQVTGETPCARWRMALSSTPTTFLTPLWERNVISNPRHLHSVPCTCFGVQGSPFEASVSIRIAVNSTRHGTSQLTQSST